VIASAAALEVFWAREGKTRLDESSCEHGDVGACARTCDALYGAEAMGQRPFVTPLQARVRGRLLRRLSRSCSHFGVHIVAHDDGGIDDQLLAFAIFDNTCDAGDPQSCVRLGVMLDEGRYVSRDHPSAMSFFRDGCDAGIRSSCRYLGVGLGADGHEAEGRAMLESTCDAGDAPSCTILDNLK
jgi:TPR repeat protein